MIEPITLSPHPQRQTWLGRVRPRLNVACLIQPPGAVLWSQAEVGPVERCTFHCHFVFWISRLLRVKRSK